MLRVKLKGQFWVEPFIGGANMIDKVYGDRIGSDVNQYLIVLFKALQNGHIPPDIVTEDTYYEIRKNKNKYPKELVGFVSFGCSFGGNFFGGYARDNGLRNYALANKQNLLKQLKYIKDVNFRCCNYTDLKIPNKSLIYCDPPYKKTIGYKECGKFNNSQFWEWCRQKTNEGHTVFISEKNAPADFLCLKEIPVIRAIDRKNKRVKNVIEKLFIWENDIKTINFLNINTKKEKYQQLNLI